MKNKLDGETILITGGTGFIGSNIIKKLRQNKNITLIVLSRTKTGKEGANLEYIKCDLLDEKTLAKISSPIKNVNYTLHLAAMMPKSSFQDELEENVEQNLIASLNLLKYLPETLKGFVYSSTIDVYGEPRYIPIDENHPTNPLTYYGISKLSAEKFINIFLRRKNIPLAILRYSQVYGPGEPKIKAIPNFIDMIIRGKSPVLYGDGSDIRDYVYVDDVVNATILALSKGLNGVFNIGFGKGYSVKEILDMIIALSRKDIKPIYKPRIKKAFKYTMDITLARDRMGYSPSTTIQEGLKNQIEFMKRKME